MDCIEGNNITNANGEEDKSYFRVRPYTPGGGFGVPYARHSGNVNTLMADGHASPKQFNNSRLSLGANQLGPGWQYDDNLDMWKRN